MKMSLLICLFIMSGYSSWSQSYTVSGTVTDQATGQALVGASVFCQHTTIGTITDAAGQFRLQPGSGGYDLVFSYSGYETQSLRINAAMADPLGIRVALKQRDKNLEAVSVVASNEVKDGWLKYGAFFTEQFIGLTLNSQNCRIENPEVLRFFFNKKKNRLKVTTREPLQVRNDALGYQVRYELDSFVHEYGTGLTQHTGYPFFQELQGSVEERQRWKERRQTAYLGSMLHFMRCYYDSTLQENGYKLEWLRTAGGRPVVLTNPYDSLFFQHQPGTETSLHIDGKLRVVFTGEKPEKKYLELNQLSSGTTVQVSILEFLDALAIEQNGYFFDQRDLLSYGYWSWEKLGDFLPYDYEPEDEEAL